MERFSCVRFLRNAHHSCAQKSFGIRVLIAALAFMLASASRTLAAEINVIEAPGMVPTILVRGEIRKGDGNEFETKVGKHNRGLVVLSSPGGNVTEALQIGAIINTQGLATMVADECASACALIWLSGVRRYFNKGAKIGFHAAYVHRNGKATETGMGNAEIGSYLTHLGLSIEVIRFVTAAPPNTIRWLSLGDAKRLGIAVIEGQSVVDPQNSNQPPSYQTLPPRDNVARKKAYQIASITSELVTALACANYTGVNEVRIRSLHKEMMREGEKIGAEFESALSSELTDRRAVLRRDGIQRYCDDQRERFKAAGIKGIFID
jgi:hypothetical protein